MATFEIDGAAGCARATASDRFKIHLNGPDGRVVLDASNDAAHQLFDLLRTQLQAASVSQLLHNAVVATRTQENG